MSVRFENVLKTLSSTSIFLFWFVFNFDSGEKRPSEICTFVWVRRQLAGKRLFGKLQTAVKCAARLAEGSAELKGEEDEKKKIITITAKSSKTSSK